MTVLFGVRWLSFAYRYCNAHPASRQFAICGVVLKITRNRLKRSYQAPLAVVLSANVVIIIAITGNIAQRSVARCIGLGRFR